MNLDLVYAISGAHKTPRAPQQGKVIYTKPSSKIRVIKITIHFSDLNTKLPACHSVSWAMTRGFLN
ncbi:hypothetical protein VP466E531_P0022 [Vibrio phage 466E53-1]|nr:hypothetical protein VP466E531_P0022 [Vibrio phage 466E53-1]